MVAKSSTDAIFRQRIVWLTVLFVVCLVVIVIRLAYMQIFQSKVYQALADSQRTGEYQLLPTRGDIKIQDTFTGEPYAVATVIEKVIVYANASEVQKNGDTIKRLSEILQIEASELEGKLADTNRKYVVLKKDISEVEQQQVTDAKLSGIYFDKETARFYPEGAMMAQLLGFVGFRDDTKKGSYGLELAYEEQLAGTPGTLMQEKDTKGRWIFGSKRDRVPAYDGDSLILTIDKTLQLKAETIIKDAVDQHQADSGSIVVMDPKTGKIVVMATYPSFDLNQYSKVEDANQYINQVTMGAYEPGSIFKPLTVAAAVNEGKISASTIFNDTGSVEIDGYTIKNSDLKAHGSVTISQVLEESLNTGTIFAKNSIGNEKFLEYVKRFGFGAKVGFEVQESAGDLANLKGNIKVNYHTASFGQGITVTPLQMVQAFSALANGGKMTKPYVVDAIERASGKKETFSPGEGTQVISVKTASEVSAMLVNVVEKGHGKKAGVPGYWVAGKTGTAQVANKNGKGYEANNNIGSFIGYAPVEDPQFVMLVRVNHPRTVSFAESTAAPAFGKMAQFLLQYYKIPPSR